MRKLRVEMGSKTQGNYVEYFEYKKGWQDKIRNWSKLYGQKGFELKIYLSEPGTTSLFNSVPNTVIPYA